MEVLSVVSVQVKSVLDAIKAKKKKFDFMGEYIILIPTIGMFITMNPGYAGRTELPENLKALFRWGIFYFCYVWDYIKKSAFYNNKYDDIISLFWDLCLQ